jgi:hypothetical protein
MTVSRMDFGTARSCPITHMPVCNANKNQVTPVFCSAKFLERSANPEFRIRKCRFRDRTLILAFLLPRPILERFTALLDVFARTFHGVATRKRAKYGSQE